MIYLDYQATTPVAPEVVEAMRPWAEQKFANPHSPSKWGREAQAAIEVARKHVAKAIGRKGGRIAFTGTATEAINWAIKGTVENAPKGRNRVVTIATEHAAVLAPTPSAVTRIAVNAKPGARTSVRTVYRRSCVSMSHSAMPRWTA